MGYGARGTYPRVSSTLAPKTRELQRKDFRCFSGWRESELITHVPLMNFRRTYLDTIGRFMENRKDWHADTPDIATFFFHRGSLLSACASIMVFPHPSLSLEDTARR